MKQHDTHLLLSLFRTSLTRLVHRSGVMEPGGAGLLRESTRPFLIFSGIHISVVLILVLYAAAIPSSGALVTSIPHQPCNNHVESKAAITIHTVRGRISCCIFVNMSLSYWSIGRKLSAHFTLKSRRPPSASRSNLCCGGICDTPCCTGWWKNYHGCQGDGSDCHFSCFWHL